MTPAVGGIGPGRYPSAVIDGALRPGPVEAVIFDFHGTLFDPGDPVKWVRTAREQLAARGERIPTGVTSQVS